MKYLCLRKCWVGDRLWYAGVEYELPDKMEKAEKNFRLLESVETPVEVEELAPSIPEKPREPNPGEYLCSKCKGIHRESSKIGTKHLKYKQEG